MPTDPTEDELRLAAVLADAEQQRAAELDALAGMDEQEVAYLDQVDTLDDPESDGIECGGV